MVHIMDFFQVQEKVGSSWLPVRTFGVEMYAKELADEISKSTKHKTRIIKK